MIYFTGDTHGELSRFKTSSAKKLKKGDTVIVCGDFGFVFGGGRREIEALDYLESKSYTVCFCDGKLEREGQCGGYHHHPYGAC